MKHIFTTALLLICLAPAYAGLTAHYGARTHAVEALPMQEMHSQCIMTSGVKYSSFVYEPFNSAAPSEYTNGQAPSTSVGKRRKLGGGTDPGEQSKESPIGEPWILLLFAAAFGGYIVWKKKKATTTSKEEI